VAGGGLFEVAKPILPSPNDYKLIFKVFVPPPGKGETGPPPVVFAPAVSPFSGSILQMAIITFEPCGVIGAHHHPRATEHLVLVEGECGGAAGRGVIETF
jgi:hypothetical protein